MRTPFELLEACGKTNNHFMLMRISDGWMCSPLYEGSKVYDDVEECLSDYLKQYDNTK